MKLTNLQERLKDLDLNEAIDIVLEEEQQNQLNANYVPLKHYPPQHYSTKDEINHPAHYTQANIECIDAIKAITQNKKGIEAVCVANVMKYLWRYEDKHGLKDVKKAQWYLNWLIMVLENKDKE